MPLNYCPHCGGNLANVSAVATCPSENTCDWRMSAMSSSGATWTCRHGVTMDHHPKGWCDGGGGACGACR